MRVVEKPMAVECYAATLQDRMNIGKISVIFIEITFSNTIVLIYLFSGGLLVRVALFMNRLRQETASVGKWIARQTLYQDSPAGPG